MDRPAAEVGFARRAAAAALKQRAPMRRLRDHFPALYGTMLGPLFDREVPEESKATCSDCAMLERPGADQVTPVDGRSRYFHPQTKCCTYHPRLPNYLVGAALADPDPRLDEGRRRLEARIDSGVGVTPEWLHAPSTYTLLYESARRAFGRARGLRCPYYDADGGGCTIWAHREAVCSTYFCKYVAGADGREFWTAAKELVSLVEIQLARLALLDVAPELLECIRWSRRPASGSIGPEDVDGERPPRAAYASAWGAWDGRERELYEACHERVRSVTAGELEALLGLDGRLAARALARALDAATSGALPPVLRLDPGATVAWLPDGSLALGGYSDLEALALPGTAYRLLVRFTGEAPVSEVRARLRAEEHADLSDEVLLQLYRQRVLIVPGATER